MIPSVLFLFCRKEIGMHKNTWPLRNSCRILCSPHFWVHKKVWPPPHLHQPTPSNKWPVPKHSTSAPLLSYLLISAFRSGVMKDREAPFSPNYDHLKDLWGLISLLVVFLSEKGVEFNLSRNIMQTEYTAPTLCSYECSLYNAANDPRPQMIPRPEMTPKLERKWSRTANDPAGKWGTAWSFVLRSGFQ